MRWTDSPRQRRHDHHGTSITSVRRAKYRPNENRPHCSRRTLAIIPQDPFLFSGTIRENLDPYQNYTDEEIHTVLEKCDLRSLVENLGNEHSRCTRLYPYPIFRQWSRFDRSRTGSELLRGSEAGEENSSEYRLTHSLSLRSSSVWLVHCFERQR